MNILAFDTSSSACSIALQRGIEIKAIHQHAPMQQAKLILPLINELLESCSMKLTELEAIAYGCGPGSFTGIRIACSVAQGLGFALKIPLIPISSMAAMAFAAFLTHAWRTTLIVLDAKMGEVYYAKYHINNEGWVELIGSEEIKKPTEMHLLMPKEGWYALGDAWLTYNNELIEQLGQPKAIDSSLQPQALGVLNLAQRKLEKGERISPLEAVPIYLR